MSCVLSSLRLLSSRISEEGKREFFIPKLNRERNLYGSDFEIKLRNKLEQKAIAKECAEQRGSGVEEEGCRMGKRNERFFLILQKCTSSYTIWK